MFRTGSTLSRACSAPTPTLRRGSRVLFRGWSARELPRYPDGLEAIQPGQISAWREQHAAMAAKFAGEGRRLTGQASRQLSPYRVIRAILPSARFVSRSATGATWRSRSSAPAWGRGRTTHPPGGHSHYLGLHEMLVTIGRRCSRRPGARALRGPGQRAAPGARAAAVVAGGRLGPTAASRTPPWANTIRTASASQVRQPCTQSRSAVGRTTGGRSQRLFGAEPDDY